MLRFCSRGLACWMTLLNRIGYAQSYLTWTIGYLNAAPRPVGRASALTSMHRVVGVMAQEAVRWAQSTCIPALEWLAAAARAAASEAKWPPVQWTALMAAGGTADSTTEARGQPAALAAAPAASLHMVEDWWRSAVTLATVGYQLHPSLLRPSTPMAAGWLAMQCRGVVAEMLKIHLALFGPCLAAGYLDPVWQP
jgi:hypothetical protein